MTEQTWQQLLEAGKIDEALLALRLQEDETERNVLVSIETLSSIQDALRAKNWSKALRLTSEQEDTEPINWQELAQELGQLKAAAELLDKRQPEAALEGLGPLQSPVLRAEQETLRGTAYIYTDQMELARQAFRNAIALDNKHYRAITNLGNLELEAGNLDEAIAAYEKALKLNDSFANALHNLGVAYRKKGQVSKSVSYLRKAQTASQRQMREEARESFRGSSNPQTLKLLRWFGFGILALILFFFLRSRGMI
ncbi:MAG: tetratricopeptide repeat protein [Trueperaceae bacterium]|nr:tetratricopeptide repeat protein [Trueperaceae bacterium]